MFEIPWIKWFMAGNIYSGSIRQESGLDCFQYRAKKDGDVLRGWAWDGPNCLAATPEEQVKSKDFSLDEQGREDLIAWLKEVQGQLN